MRIPLTLAVTLAVLIGAIAPAIAVPAAALGSDDVRAPMADAGLDQRVPQGTTVHLDATGSRDLDGTIAHYEWVITRPDGTTQIPPGFTNAETSFVPTEPGRWEVTLHVTDSAGHTSTDTLYVDVESVATDPPSTGSPGTGPGTSEPSTDSSGGGGASVTPSVQIIGPSSVPPGESATYRARITDPDGSVAESNWLFANTDDYSGVRAASSTSETITKRFSTAEAGETVTISLTVNDGDGSTVTATKDVQVLESNAGPHLSISGPSVLASGETGSFSASSYGGYVSSFDWNIEMGMNDGSSARKSWSLGEDERSKVVTVTVTGLFEDGTAISETMSVRIFNNYDGLNFIEGEIDPVGKQGFEGLLRGINEWLTGEEAQTTFGNQEDYVVGEDAGRTNSLSYKELLEATQPTEGKQIGPNTVIVDDQDGGKMDELANTAYTARDASRRQGDMVDSAATGAGNEFRARAMSASRGMLEESESAGNEIDDYIDEAGTSMGETIESGYSSAGNVVGSAAASVVTSKTRSVVAGEMARGATESGYDAVGRGTNQVVSEASNTVGDTMENEVSRAGIKGAAAGLAAGMAGDAAAETIGDAGEAVHDVGASALGGVGDSIEATEATINDALPGNDGEADDTGDTGDWLF